MSDARVLLRRAPVVPVLTIETEELAVPLARSLVDGGLPVLEVTLRSAAALPAIAAIREALPGAIVGAGTVTSPAQLESALGAGSAFIVTPGLTDGLVAAAAGMEVPLIPGVATVSELMRAREVGLDCLKFFPAEAAGGSAALKAFAGPFPDIAFCPTGGIGLENLDEYLALPNVLTVGGSWLTPPALLAARDWHSVGKLAAATCARVAALRGVS
jgi:2-dehydro-3-deoxyphosphogluconate aldolase/(4S)-4-hydroxy-2-oxoglutarate aldolase